MLADVRWLLFFLLFYGRRLLCGCCWLLFPYWLVCVGVCCRVLLSDCGLVVGQGADNKVSIVA